MINPSYEQILDRKYRDEIDIIAAMLTVARHGAKQTEIMYRANLNHELLKKYLKRTIDNKLLEKTKENDNTIYKITVIGEYFLEEYRVYSRKIKNSKKKLIIVRTLENELTEMCKPD